MASDPSTGRGRLTHEASPGEKFSRAFLATPTAMTLSTAKEDRLIDVNETWVHLTGYPREEAIGRTPLELNLLEDPEDYQRLNHQLEAQRGSLRGAECRFRMRDGRIIIGSFSAEEFDVNGEALRIVVMADITGLKQLKEALSRTSQQLIRAQEQERFRIARDLHDDIGQRLALLQMGIDQVKESIPAPTEEVLWRMDELSKQAADIARDIRELSHGLHSPKLRLLGIDQALRGLCEDVHAQLNLAIDFRSHDVPTAVGTEASLCLFRVLQEALNNSAKHSGTSRVDVELWGTFGAIHLRIRDFGSGFPSVPGAGGTGLGLMTMRERVGMVGGTWSIASTPQVGTEINIRVPLSAIEADEPT
jgi:PAS domain S-box-containing protein